MHVVCFDWLSASFKSSTKLDESTFLHGGGVSGPMLSSPSPSRNLTATPVLLNDSKKRPRDEDVPNADSEAARRAKLPTSKADATAKTPAGHVPVDEHCTVGGTPRVQIDQDGTVFDATLSQTNANRNNNKFYRIQLLETNGDFLTWTRWGGVGERGQNCVVGDGDFESASREFKKKFRSKTGLAWADRQAAPNQGKYTFLELDYEDTGSENAAALLILGSAEVPGTASMVPELCRKASFQHRFNFS